MPTDFQRFRSAKFLVVLVFLACASGLSAANTAIANAAPSYILHGPARAHVPTTRQLRVHSVGEDAEERGIANNPSAAKFLYKLTPNKQEAVEQLSKRFKLGKNTPSLFTNANFLEWEKTVAKSFKSNPEAADMAMYLTMKAHYGDEALVKMLAAAKEVSATKPIAARLQDAQLSNWASGSSGKTAADAFKLLGLERAGDNILTNTEFHRWVSFAEGLGLSRRNNAYSTLVAQYGDEALARMLATAREVSDTKSIAKRVQSLPFSSWIDSGIRVDDAFKLFRLDRGDDNIFARPEFRSWVSFIIRRRNEGPVDRLLKVAMMYSLHAHYSDEALAKMVFAAKEVPSTRHTATTLEDLLFSEWRSKKKTGAELFKLFQLDEAGARFSRVPHSATGYRTFPN